VVLERFDKHVGVIAIAVRLALLLAEDVEGLRERDTMNTI